MCGKHYCNKMLQHLSAESLQRLQLRPVRLELRQTLEEPGKAIRHIYFLEEGIASMTTTFQDGFEVEVGMFGLESAIGTPALMGSKESRDLIFMQLAGHGFASRLQTAQGEFDRHGAFHDLTLRYVQAQMTQARQSAACNVHHNNEQRLARWILACSDHSQQSEMRLSQEFLADMLGSARPTVTVAAQVLKAKGVISYQRGVIEILDRKGLEILSCECYRRVKTHLDHYFEQMDADFAA